MTSNPNSPTRPALGLGHHAPDHRALRSSCGLGRGGGFWNLQSTDRCSAKTDRSPAKSSFCLADMSGSRGAIFSSCVILASCTSLSPSGSSPIASWSGKHSIEDAVDCVKRALDDNYRSPRPLIPSVTHHVDTVEQGRVSRRLSSTWALPRSREIKWSRINSRRAFYARHDVQCAIARRLGKMPIMKRPTRPTDGLRQHRRQGVRSLIGCWSPPEPSVDKRCARSSRSDRSMSSADCLLLTQVVTLQNFARPTTDVSSLEHSSQVLKPRQVSVLFLFFPYVAEIKSR